MKLISIWLLILMVQTMPSSLNNPTKYDAEQIRELDLWGDYAIPQDNFYSEDKKIEHKIWALGLVELLFALFDTCLVKLLFVLFSTYKTQFHLALNKLACELLVRKSAWKFYMAAAEGPKGSGNFTAEEIPFSCAQNSPIATLFPKVCNQFWVTYTRSERITVKMLFFLPAVGIIGW
ncbi:hypothetical protein FEM48_Zijuj10G0069800 [Ziziphus jujuba var. spinosa]|uniref:Uncharacterized protein n=1 Tax=Ziziphus jujuba var. spinosa TaxID=714518 RepID=A0A978ULZ6_ZIZJJ|nr:hypothetical protein FEM48_Zijuj10G0069800 [Ziziphus jujuba var. spinosa]